MQPKQDSNVDPINSPPILIPGNVVGEQPEYRELWIGGRSFMARVVGEGEWPKEVSLKHREITESLLKEIGIEDYTYFGNSSFRINSFDPAKIKPIARPLTSYEETTIQTIYDIEGFAVPRLVPSQFQ